MTIAKIQFRRGTTAQWVAEDPILSLGEPGIELKTDDSIGLKIGNGSDSWTELSYYSSEDFVTQSELNTAINGLVDSAPSALNTLNELAAALGDDSSFATTITNAIAAKADATHTHTISNVTNLQTSLDAKANLASPTFTGTVVLPSTTSVGNVSSTELGYLDGVTSALQTQLNGKQATITGGATTIASSNLTASRALASDTSGKVAVSTVTSTELGYLSGVTSAIQTQINAKANLASPTFTGTVTLPSNTVTNDMLAGSIADSKLGTISTAGKVSNSATTATSANTASAIVARDASNNFSTGTITATGVVGRVTVNSGASANVGRVFVHNPSGGNPTGAVAGDIWIW